MFLPKIAMKMGRVTTQPKNLSTTHMPHTECLEHMIKQLGTYVNYSNFTVVVISAGSGISTPWS